MVETTTMKIKQETKMALGLLKIHPRETYDDVLKRLIKIGRKHK